MIQWTQFGRTCWDRQNIQTHCFPPEFNFICLESEKCFIWNPRVLSEKCTIKERVRLCVSDFYLVDISESNVVLWPSLLTVGKMGLYVCNKGFRKMSTQKKVIIFVLSDNFGNSQFFTEHVKFFSINIVSMWLTCVNNFYYFAGYLVGRSQAIIQTRKREVGAKSQTRS